ncbi:MULTISPECIES: GTPase HflX [unclassified Paenibacillus]|uniref:GTPase HflX n=1 Tax=unclassified Paenibacillus TaxID=185978 RepID=UPI001AE86DBB|nr:MULTISPECIES: GTPase HflX [unclassified Paenibacillus]MBP1155453.1 GTP-binding protein HflX [Paenibacillus sp. PvP091]MBP1169162.1 GTP-binding protein HflX [Paenibacillus sp. PvR098]MBP2440190.1 GTP-binding protein HflX [Paenibacillus sp. PvP052]
MRKTSHEVMPNAQENAILVSLITAKHKKLEAYDPEFSLSELASLAETARVDVLGTLTQNKEYADSKWFIGKGKAEELKGMIEETGANTAIFDQELSGAQVRNLEQFLDVKIIDRTQLILDIFAQRAKTREGIIQVELAQLTYLLPRLYGQGKNLSRLGGGIGTRGPGESKLETDRRHIRDRINELKRQLQEVVRHRSLHRERRKKSGVYQVALVGYTNAGKSTVLRQLTLADVYVENQLFATLDPTSRSLKLPGGMEIVITDTVGFIQNLPHDLVAAFRATLEEACEADLILHIVDSSSEMMAMQMKVVDQVLEELGAHGKERVTVFNKIDQCPSEQADMLTAEGEFLRISAYREEDLNRIKELLETRMMGGSRTFRIPADKGDVISLVYRVGEVLENEVDGNDMLFKVRVNNKEFDKIGYMLAAYDAVRSAEGEQGRDV